MKWWELACLTPKTFLNIKARCFHAVFLTTPPWPSTSYNNYTGLKSFAVLYMQKVHVIQNMFKNSTNIYFLHTHGKDTELSGMQPLVHAAWRHKSFKQAGNRGATLPGAPHKAFSPLQPFRRDSLCACSAVLRVQSRYISGKAAAFPRAEVFPPCLTWAWPWEKPMTSHWFPIPP